MVWLMKAWFVGDFVLASWMPRMLKTTGMIDYKLFMYIWLIFDMAASIATWFVWKDNGKWAGISLIPLIIASIYFFTTVLYFYVFNVFYRIRISLYISIFMAALSLTLAIWYFILQTAPGIIAIFVFLWNGYNFFWIFMFSRANTVNGKIKTSGKADITVAETADVIPCEEAFKKAGRRSFFTARNKFGGMPTVIGKGSDASQTRFVSTNETEQNLSLSQTLN